MATLINSTRGPDIINILKDNGVVPDVPILELKMHIAMDSAPEIEIKFIPDASKTDKLTKP